MKKYVIEFKDFLKEYAIVAMAIAFIMGAAAKDLMKSLVDDIIMPLVNPLLSSGGGWETAVWKVGPAQMNIGVFLSNVLTFVILALVVFLIAKKLLKEEKVKKR